MRPPGKPLALTERIYFIDAARAVLMFLGVPYHTSLAYSYFSGWTVKSDELSYIASCLASFIHAFRMPAFFVVAGYFSVLVLRKRGAISWIRYRVPRLAVPMLTIGLLVNPFVMLAASFSKTSGRQILVDWRDQLSHIGSHWVAQLWFLGDLLLYSIALTIIVLTTKPALRERIRRTIDRYPSRNLWLNLAALLALGMFVTGAAVCTKLLGLSQFANGFIFPSRTFAQLPFFFFGSALALSPKHLDEFTTFRRGLIAPTLLGCLVFAILADRKDAPSTLATFFITPAVGLASAQLIFSIARKWLNRPSRLVQLGVDSAMTVYLVHIFFVVWLVVLFRSVAAPAFVEVVAISLIAAGLSLAVNTAARRLPVLFYLLHGHKAKSLSPAARS